MENSKIEWTDHTFNPWIGCDKVSPGCKNCYAEALDKRWGRNNWGRHASRTRTSAANWAKPIAWNKKAEKEGRRYRVFCASLADVFERHGNFEIDAQMSLWRAELFAMIEGTPHLDWLLLTKRPQNVLQMVPREWTETGHEDGRNLHGFPPNVWIGTTVENQEQADIRIPELLKIPAHVRFLSCEPLLGPVDLNADNGLHGGPAQIDWVISGGESGHGARPMHPDWARSLRDQCVAASVPFLFKQWGEYLGGESHSDGDQVFFNSADAHDDAKTIVDRDAEKTENGNESFFIRLHQFDESRDLLENSPQPAAYRVGKKAAGRLLDGREWNELPKGGAQ